MQAFWRPRTNLGKAIGPGILMAGAAIGGSHLVSSTQAGAIYGWSLLLLLLLANLFKYPFFLYSVKYRASTGDTILHGYRRMGKGYLAAFFGLNLINAFLNVAGVAFITASLFLNFPFMGDGDHVIAITMGILILCAALIIAGHYQLLDKIAKVVVFLLAVSTLTAVIVAVWQSVEVPEGFVGRDPWDLASIGFIIMFMGWMPAPIDVAAWPSLWRTSREIQTGHRATMQESTTDFHIGYIVTVVLAVFFLALGALVMYRSGAGIELAELSSGQFAARFIEMYTSTIGDWAHWIIVLAAFTAMFSTTITCMDGWPRSLAMSTILLFDRPEKGLQRALTAWIVFTVVVCIIIINFFLTDLLSMLQFAMVASFLSSPVFAWLNYRAIQRPEVAPGDRPGPFMHVLSWAGMAFFVVFTLIFAVWFFGLQEAAEQQREEIMEEEQALVIPATYGPARA
ncbi:MULTISPECIES: NRAMP family divalent metal transporter [Thioalkalivibrio]|uniref:NRAMP family divalent metal transporter n=1 Tax=Thioalkalivibrio TaxID=106633 RepID=UPI0003664A6B|nr:MULTISPECIES: divalent metal cation transporter [Thioalkalivibrio]